MRIHSECRRFVDRDGISLARDWDIGSGNVAARAEESDVDFLERSVWPTLPKRERGRRLTRAEEDEILGYGRGGV